MVTIYFVYPGLWWSLPRRSPHWLSSSTMVCQKRNMHTHTQTHSTAHMYWQTFNSGSNMFSRLLKLMWHNRKITSVADDSNDDSIFFRIKCEPWRCYNEPACAIPGSWTGSSCYLVERGKIKVSKRVTDDVMPCFSGMCKKSEQLTPEQRALAIK